MKIEKKICKITGIIILLLIVIFLAGRYGWKLWGFRACQSPEIENIAVSEDSVTITGFYPGSFPEGFCGCITQEQDGKLYVGFRFSAVFGFFETGDFNVTIPVKGEIDQVILKTSMREDTIWSRENGFVPQSEQYGVFVRLEREDVYCLAMDYEGFSGGALPTDGGAWEPGEYIFMDNDIMMVAKGAEAPIPFTIAAQGADGPFLAVGEFQFEADKEKMFLTITADGRIEEDMQEQTADMIKTEDSHIEQSESTAAILPRTEKTSALELKKILDEINLDIQPGAAWNDTTLVKVASHLLDWGVETSMGTEEIRQTVVSWLSDKGDAERADFKEKLAEVYEVYQQLIGSNAEELLEAAGCEDAAYPWSDSPVETIEAMIEAVQLPEREVYPGADVVELVNRKGDITTAYKLLDGRYMDRIDRIFVFDGKDTWTDEDGVEWNEVVK